MTSIQIFQNKIKVSKILNIKTTKVSGGKTILQLDLSRYFSKIVTYFSSDKYPEVEVVDHVEVVLIFLRKLHVIFHSGCTYLHSHQQFKKFPFSPCPFLFLVFLVDIPIDTR